MGLLSEIGTAGWLADGSTTQVLIPKVYLRRPASGDLGASGALIAGSSVVIKTSGEFV